MSNPLEKYLQPTVPKKKKDEGNPLDKYLGATAEEEETSGGIMDSFIRGKGREGLLGHAEDVGRGVLTTAVTGLPGLVEAGAGLASHIPVVGGVAKPLKDKLKEYREGWTEEIDPRGGAGAIGELAGVLLPGGVGGAYGKAYTKSGQILERAPVIGKTVSKLAARAAEKSTGTMGQKLAGLIARAPARAATSAIRGAPINIGIAAGLEDDPEAMKKQIAFGIVGDLIFGTIDRGVAAHPKSESKPITVEGVAKAAESPPSVLSVDRQEQLGEIQKKGLEKKAAKEAQTKLLRVVKGRYEAETMESWQKLPAEERKKKVAEFVNANPDHPAVKGVPVVEPHPDPVVEKQAETLAETVTPHVEAKIAEILEANPDATPEELKAEVQKIPEVKRAIETPTLTDHQTVNDGGAEVKHFVQFDTTKGPFRAIVYVTQDGQSARLDWLGHMEKPEVKLGAGETKALLRELKGQFPDVKNVAYDRAGGTHRLMPEAERQKSKEIVTGLTKVKRVQKLGLTRRFQEHVADVRKQTPDGEPRVLVETAAQDILDNIDLLMRQGISEADAVEFVKNNPLKELTQNELLSLTKPLEAAVPQAPESGQVGVPVVPSGRAEPKTAAELRAAMEGSGMFIEPPKEPTQIVNTESSVASTADRTGLEDDWGVAIHALDKPGGAKSKNFEIPSDEYLLHVDKPFAEQGRAVQDGILATDIPIFKKLAIEGKLDEMSGADILDIITKNSMSHPEVKKAGIKDKIREKGKARSTLLASVGIKGIRSKGRGVLSTGGFVTIFNPADIKLADKTVTTPGVRFEDTPEYKVLKAEQSDTELDTLPAGSPEPVGSTGPDAKEMDDIQEAAARAGLFEPDPDRPGAAAELYVDFLNDARRIVEANLPHDQHIAAVTELIESYRPHTAEEKAALAEMDAEQARSREAPPEEPVPLTPEEEAALLAETQEAGLMPEEPAATMEPAPEQGTLTQDTPDTTPLANAPELGGEAPPPPVSTTLESAPGDISQMTDKQLDRVETKLIKKIDNPKTPDAERAMAQRDLDKIFEWQRQQNAALREVAPPPESLLPPIPSQATGAEILPPRPIPERPKPSKVKVKVEGETRLLTVNHEKPLEEMTVKERQKLADKLRAKINKLQSSEGATEKLQAKINEIQGDLDLLNDVSGTTISGGGSVAVKEALAAAKEADQVATALGGGEELPKPVFAKMFRAKLKDMNKDDLVAFARGLTYEMTGNVDSDAVKLYQEKLHRVMEEIALRSRDEFGKPVQIPPGVGGGVLGYAVGYYSTDDDEDRVTNGLMWAAVGAGGGMLAGRMLKRGTAPKIDRTAAELPGGDWQATVGQHIITGRTKEGRQVPFLERFRDIYFQTVRRSYVGERFAASIGAERLPTVMNPARLMAMFGRWTGQTEAALREGPSLYDEFGNAKHLGAKGAHQIFEDIEGDVETLGTLMAVRTFIEQGGTIKAPFDMVQALNAFQRIPEKFHRAADDARQLSFAMLQVLADAGIVARDKLAVYADEKWYAALERVFKFDPDLGGPAAEKGQDLSVGAQNPFKNRKKGSKDAIKNPFETLIESIPRFYRAAELNKIKASFVDAWEAAGKPKEWMELVSGKDAGDFDLHLKKVDEIKAAIKGTSDDEAHALVAALDPNAMNIEKGTMRIYRDGKIQNYRIHGDLARALLSLNPDEMHMFIRALGAPARLASTGVVLNPFFVAKMGFFDMFQATLNSQYGFRFGVDNARGWWNIVTRSKRYQDLLSVGLTHQSLAGANIENIKTTFDAIKRTEGKPLEVAIRHLKEARPLEFYKALVAPVADAARVGEALRALDHGASTLDAVYAAKTVTGNYQERGAWAGMRGLQHMTMFLGPALQVLDQAAYRGGVHPFRKSEQGRVKDFATYGGKAFLTIALPSWYFWHAAQGDDEIKDLRTSDTGRKWWFYRLPWDVSGHGKKGDIVKIPKPILDGQLMGTTVEMVLDKMYGNDPVASSDLAKSVLKDAAFNLTPSVGVMYYGLQAGQDLSRGYELYPTWEKQLDLEHRGESSASFMSRQISQKIAPVGEAIPLKALQNATTPAGLDFLTNAIGGMLGRDALLAAGQAAEYASKGYAPASRELPIIKEVLVTYPSTRVRSIQDFYRKAEEVDRAATTLAHWMKEDPDKAVNYMEANMENIQLAKTFDSARSQIANYRRAIQNIKEMDSKMISPEERRKIIKEYTEMMIETAKMANEIAMQ